MAIMGFNFRLRTAAMVMASMSLQQGSVAGLGTISPKAASEAIKELEGDNKKLSKLWNHEETAALLVLADWKNLKQAKTSMILNKKKTPALWRALERAAVRSAVYEKHQEEVSENEAEAILRQAVPKLTGTDDDAAWDNVPMLIEECGISKEGIDNARQYIQKMKRRFDKTLMAAIGSFFASFIVLIVLVIFLYFNDGRDANSSPMLAKVLLAGFIALFLLSFKFGRDAWQSSQKATSSVDNFSRGLNLKAREHKGVMGKFLSALSKFQPNAEVA